MAYGCGSVPDFDRLPLLEGGCVTGRPASSDRTRPMVEPSHPARQGAVGTVGPVSAVDAAEAEPTPRDPEYRCSPWTQAQGVDPIGSAGAFDELLLVEWALPWPSDVSEIEPLAAAAADPRARVMTVVPHADTDRRRAAARRPPPPHEHPPPSTRVDHRVAVDAIPDLLAALLDAARSAAARLADRRRRRAPGGAGVRPRPPRSVLRALGHAAARRAGRPRLGARACGGAATPAGIGSPPPPSRCPDGRAWAYADVGAPRRRARPHRRRRRAGGPRSRLHRLRPVGAGRGAGAVRRARLGAGWTARSRSAHTEVADDGQSATVELEWRLADGTTGRTRGEVEVTRILPVLVCGEPPEMAKKTSPELALRPPRRLSRLGVPNQPCRR